MISACNNPSVLPNKQKNVTSLAVFLVIAGAIGFAAAFTLTLDKLALLENPNAQLSCNFSILVGCGTNLGSWQGQLFGFPNSLIGLVGWTAVIAVGVGLLARARFARWFWLLFNAGIIGAMALVIFLISESIFTLLVLCPWCMVTWVVTIPTFWVVTLHNLRTGNIPVRPLVRQSAATLYRWVPLISLACYVIVFLLAQVQLDVINRL
jgi:uncharacterized membrane protein